MWLFNIISPIKGDVYFFNSGLKNNSKIQIGRISKKESTRKSLDLD